MSIRIAGQVIASAGSLTAHNEDPNAHPDIRELISQGGGGGNAGSADIAKAIENQNKESGTVDPIYNWLGTQQEYEEQNVVQEHPDWVCFITDDAESGEEEKEYYTKEEIDSKISEVGEDVASNTQGIGNVSEEVSALSDRVLVLENNTSGGGESESAKVAEGVENKNDNDGALEPIYHWIGSKAEYEEQKIKEEHPDWVCFITDDVSEENDGSGNSSFPLFYHTFADHILNDASWLRADTFSWQSGDMYVSAYNHLVADYEGEGKQKNTTVYSWAFGEGYSGYNPYTLSEKPSNGSLVFWADIYSIKGILGRVVSFDEETNSFEYEDYKAGTTKIAISPTSKEKLSSFAIDTIGSTEITFYRAEDGHKIVLADQESKVSEIYRSTGVAWYYILDTENKRFKLPRTKWAFTGLRNAVGNFIEAGLPNITGQTNFAPNAGMRYDAQPRGAFYKATATGHIMKFEQAAGNDLGFDASLSSEVYGKSDTVQPHSTEQYLYFYVGNTVRNQTEVNVGTVTEHLNGKADLNLSNANPSKNFRENVFNWGLPDFTSGVTKSWNTDIVAETNGWVRFHGNLVDDGAAMVMSINGENVFYLAYRFDAQGTSLQMIPVSKGDVYKCYGGSDSQAITFYPCKGETL